MALKCKKIDPNSQPQLLKRLSKFGPVKLESRKKCFSLISTAFGQTVRPYWRPISLAAELFLRFEQFCSCFDDRQRSTTPTTPTTPTSTSPTPTTPTTLTPDFLGRSIFNEAAEPFNRPQTSKFLFLSQKQKELELIGCQK